MTRALSRVEYQRYCTLLGVEPNETLSTDEERGAAIPAWLDQALIQTTAARNKLRAWCRGTPPPPWDGAGDPATVLLALAAYGDPVVPHVIATTLAGLPPPVRDYCVKRVTWLGAGMGFGGWCGARPAFSDRPWWIMIARTASYEDAHRFAGVIAHEAAHSWLMNEPEPGRAQMSAFEGAAYYDLEMHKVPAVAKELVTSLRVEYDIDEQQVRTLIGTWGFHDV